MKFTYLARTKKGEMQTGAIDAASESAAIETLQSHNLVVVAIEASTKVPFFSKKIKLFERINRKDVLIFSRQLSILVGSDVPLLNSLRSLEAQTAKGSFRDIISKIADDVEGGTLLSKALDKYPKIFTPFFVNLVKSGEASGRLQAALDFLAEHLEKEYYLISKVQRAMYYPSFILGAFVLIAMGMVVFIMPTIGNFLNEFGAELPLITRVLLVVSGFIADYILFILLFIIVVAGGLWLFYRTPSGKALFDRMQLEIPIIGPIFQKTYIAHFTKNLSTLIKGGLPIIQALDITAKVVENTVIRKIVIRARDEVSKGNTISSVFENENLIPAVVTQMIKTGESTGRLDFVLVNLSGFYTKEVDNIVDNLSSLIEPVLIVGLGSLVGLLMAALLIPLYSLSTVIQ